jgi:nicotinamidase-related amidase
MAHANILDPARAALVVIDVQEAFRDVIPDFGGLVSRIAAAVNGFQVLGVPVIATEQYPKGLGPIVEELRLVMDEANLPFEKTAFSSYRADSFAETLGKTGVSQVVLCGIEAHICVNQTAHDLIERGFQVHLLCDCVSSRFDYNRLAGIAKMTRAGAIESSTEMALFEMMGDSKHENFKEIQSIIK